MKHLLGKTLGNYQLKRILGQGRMGVVFLANDKALLRPTALKLMAWSMENEFEQDPVKWFLSEARSVARISHPNVIQIYNIARHGEYRYIAMEYIDGESAERALERHGRFTAARATDILIQTCHALEAAHSVGVIHRDIKPANLLLRRDGVVKLSDFGMAMSSYGSKEFTANMRVGTPFFNAPETWAGRPASPASDIYALGVTYFLMLTGKLPFVARSMDELQQAHMSQTPLNPASIVADLPPLCGEITSRCLAKKEFQRFESATELGSMAQKLYEQLINVERRSSTSLSPGEFNSGKVPGSEYESASAEWMETLRFTLAPFGALNPNNVPYNGGPFLRTFNLLHEAILKKKKIIFLHGEKESGKSAILRKHGFQSTSDSKVIFLERRKAEQTISLIEELCRISRIHPSSDSVLHELEKWLFLDAQQTQRRILIYVDDVSESDLDMEELSLLVQLVQRIDACSIIVGTDTHSLGTVLSTVPIGQKEIIELPPLTASEVRKYIQSWLNKTRTLHAPMLLVSTDAAFWVAHQSHGNPGKINRLLRCLLETAAQKNISVISTRDAWRCGQQMMNGASISDNSGLNATEWPNPEVIRIINFMRKSAGIAPLSQEMTKSLDSSPNAEKEDMNEQT